MSIDSKFTRKHSNSNLSVKSSSSESISESALKDNQENMICKAFEHERMDKKIQFYLSKLEQMVIDDPNQLSKISLACEPNVQSSQSTLKSSSTIFARLYMCRYWTTTSIIEPSKHAKSQDDLIFQHNHFGPSDINTGEISDKAAEILGLKCKFDFSKL